MNGVIVRVLGAPTRSEAQRVVNHSGIKTTDTSSSSRHRRALATPYGIMTNVIRRALTAVLLAPILVASTLMASSAHAATPAARCTKRLAVHGTKVCLPGATKNTLTWQAVPKFGRVCIRRNTTYKTLVCAKFGKRLTWKKVSSSIPMKSTEVARAGARAMLAKLHAAFYRDGDIIKLDTGFRSIETMYASHTAKVGLTPTGYFLTLDRAKSCYAASDDDPGISDTTC